MYTSCLFELVNTIINSDSFSNITSFFSLIVAIIALIIGNNKVSNFLSEYEQKKRNAVFSYHINLSAYIHQLRKLISDNQGGPLGNLYLLSAIDSLREKGKGYEPFANELKTLSRKFLDYISSKSEQIPAGKDEKEETEWCNLQNKLIEYLSDFILYRLNAFSPRLNDENAVKEYQKELIRILDRISDLISKDKKDLVGKHIAESSNESIESMQIKR